VVVVDGIAVVEEVVVVGATGVTAVDAADNTDVPPPFVAVT
jgi:hypothetical protein